MNYDASNPQFRRVLDHGFVYLVDHMGDDGAICSAARLSYGTGTKSVREDRGLIRYLMRHRHTSPIEAVVIKFHLKVPIFVMRQLIRHRTHSANEYSGRYSIMSDDFYIPELEVIQPQSTDNRQGRSGTLSDRSRAGVRWLMETASLHSHQIYEVLLGQREGSETIYDPYGDGEHVSPLLDDDFPGIARESARAVLPVNFYTEVYWQQNLWNLFHLLKLRTDSHAQYETRKVAEAMYDLITPIVPAACEAYEDYLRDAATLSRMELQLVHDLLHGKPFAEVTADDYGMTAREMREFKNRFGYDEVLPG